jgi:hypothetical protein
MLILTHQLPVILRPAFFAGRRTCALARQRHRHHQEHRSFVWTSARDKDAPSSPQERLVASRAEDPAHLLSDEPVQARNEDNEQRYLEQEELG